MASAAAIVWHIDIPADPPTQVALQQVRALIVAAARQVPAFYSASRPDRKEPREVTPGRLAPSAPSRMRGQRPQPTPERGLLAGSIQGQLGPLADLWYKLDARRQQRLDRRRKASHPVIPKLHRRGADRPSYAWAFFRDRLNQMCRMHGGEARGTWPRTVTS